MDKRKTRAIRAVILYLIFIVFTILVKTVDVQAIGPSGSSVGFAGINGLFHEITGVNDVWYMVSKVFGILAFAVCGFFGLFGMIQMIKRKSLKSVDRDILVLGAFYVVVAVCYVLFELVIINYRPIITDEGLEASYPSTHTLIIICIMISAAMQVKTRITNETIKNILTAICILITVLTVFGRLVCGVHWLTDIVGAILLSVALLYTYYSFVTDDMLM